jgi:hypothetical protein
MQATSAPFFSNASITGTNPSLNKRRLHCLSVSLTDRIHQLSDRSQNTLTGGRTGTIPYHTNVITRPFFKRASVTLAVWARFARALIVALTLMLDDGD